MTAVTQTIPNLVLGISQQPDELMLPGQLKDAKNVFLDVATGLQKRPGAQLVGSAISNDSTGKWFAIDRDVNEQYIGRIKTNGEVEIWSALDGTPRIVRYQSVPYKDLAAERQSFIATIEAANTNALPVSKSCDAAAFSTAATAVAVAEGNLKAKLSEIDIAEQKLKEKQAGLACSQVWSYKTSQKSLNTFNGGSGPVAEITGRVVGTNGTTYDYNQPAVTANTTVSVGDFIQDIDVRISAGTAYVYAGAIKAYFQQPVYKTIKGKLYAWKVCYDQTYINNQTSADISAINTLKAQVPALQSALDSATATYITRAAECGVFISPYATTSGSGPYVFLSVDPSTVDENGTPNITYTFTRFGNLTGSTTVYYSVGGTATINTDYVLSGDGTVSATATDRQITFTSGQTTKNVTINPTGDTTFEDNETVYFQIKSSNTYSTSTTVPVYSGILNDDVPEAGSVLPYLRHSDPDDLRTFTINDYTFVCNRNSTGLVGPGPVSMSQAETSVRPYEAFIELTQVAYGKQYAINLSFYGTGQSETTVTQAESINVVTSSWTGTDGACPYIDTDVFDVNPASSSANPDADWIETVDGHKYYKEGGTWKKKDPASPTLNRTNLRFELVTTGQSIPNNYSDATKGYYCRYSTESTLEVGGEGWQVGDKVQVTMSGQKYQITIGTIRTTKVFASAGLIRPTATSTSGSTVIKAADILNDLKAAIDGTTTGFTTQIIGNGLYLKHSLPFSIETSEAQLMNVFTDQVNNITRLPTQCKDGYIVKVINSNAEEDDYYLKFKVKQGSNLKSSATIKTTAYSGSSVTTPTSSTADYTAFGEGVWEETVKPGIKTKLNSSTMPHQIVRTPDGSFIVSPIDWEERLTGDDRSNPIPSFVGKFIQGIGLCRNRMVLLSDENVVMSRPGDYFNFFAQTALTVTAADPIDIAVGSTKPASLRACYPAKPGLVVFGDTEQYLISTSEDVFSPETVQLTTISNYKFNSKTQPIGLGTSIAFVGDTGKYSAMYEIVEIPTNTEAKIIEQSKLVASLLPDTIDQVVSTKDYSSIFLGDTGSPEVWVYRYFETGERRVQGAWFRWELTGDLLYHSMLSDGYYVVLKNIESLTGKDVITIQRFDLKKQEWSTFVQNEDAYSFNVHLDNAKIVYGTEMTYDDDKGSPTYDTTTFTIPYGYYSDKELVVYSLSEGEYAGLAATPTVTYSPGSGVTGSITVSLDGDWTDTRLLLGYTFEMDVKLPTFYVKQSTSNGDVRSDTRSSLILHRVKINFGDSGIYQTTLKRLGHEDYTEEYAVPLYDQYQADTVALKERYTQTVPVYARNTDTTFHIMSKHPSPATIYSVTWEGDTNNRYYSAV